MCNEIPLLIRQHPYPVLNTQTLQQQEPRERDGSCLYLTAVTLNQDHSFQFQTNAQAQVQS